MDNSTPDDLVSVDSAGLACTAGGFHVDPWGAVDCAVITHAHADHARPVMKRALVAAAGVAVARARLPGVELQPVAYGERVRLGDVVVSLHPSGHILGAAQVRIERVVDGARSVCVVSGDYKLAPDPTCAAFEPVPCDVFISEATYGLPIFRFDPPKVTLADVAAWWASARAEGRSAIVYGYALGKCARVLMGLREIMGDVVDGAVYTHGAVENMLAAYREMGVKLPPTTHLQDVPPAGSLILAPPSAQNTPWSAKLLRGDATTAFFSGFMRIRGVRRRRSVDRGFALSDHADWPELLRAVTESKAARVLVTHGYTSELSRHLVENGVDAKPLLAKYEGELVGDA